MLHAVVEDYFKSMVKSSGRVKYLRFQCTTLIQISRYLWAYVGIMEGSQYDSFQNALTLDLRFVVMSERAVRDVAAHSTSNGRDFKDQELQARLDEVTEELWSYWDQLTSVVDSDHYDPIRLMYEARKMDEERQRTIITTNNIKKVPLPKREVPFYIHDGSPTAKFVSHRLCRESTIEEVLFKLSRGDTAIKLQEKAFFYTNISWKGNDTMAVNLGLTPSKTSELCSKKRLSSFKEFFDTSASLPVPLPVHVFVDRDPCIHILLTTKEWSRLFSLAIIIEKNQTIVLKGVDGTLYPAKQVVDELIAPNTMIRNYGIYRRANRVGKRDRHLVGLPPTNDCIRNLLQVREYIYQADIERGKQTTSTTPSWLIEIDSEALNEHPDFGKWGSNPKFASGLRPAMRQWKPATSIAVGSSAGTTLHASNAGQPDQVHSLVKPMAQKYEERRKKNEKKDKSFWGKLFGKK
ncbi:unnamed protein product [Rhizoctonia solani]|uniref:Uncharacterized protein n=1 Tax=Rhizoctonia solani TaxID=456999 RepID=A0A8H3E4A9_9AGAM|nr:unnamed protein product [Rhizoctonia solani]